MRLLLIEDDAPLANGLAASLRQSGYTVDWCADGVAAELALRRDDYRLVILDLNLPGRDGFEVLRRLRAQHLSLPVLILSAREASAERVRGLDLGADDYPTKPFDLDELEARVRALIRRSQGLASAIVEVGRLSLDTRSRRVLHSGRMIELTGREYALLELLVLRAGQVVSKQQIATGLRDWSEEMSPGAIEIHIHRVRKKIEGAGIALRTLRGFGYLLEAGTPVHEPD
ncbi:transcriptional regulatory protein tctD [mine drainage metagenome]|uniref:Transcriptional regulatory protein tctD n=1 Tax=mine drainage metagenome TaxID=410659 RepID=A0A1J5SZQ4_9ZZZZ